jgi:hypothetical protein
MYVVTLYTTIIVITLFDPGITRPIYNIVPLYIFTLAPLTLSLVSSVSQMYVYTSAINSIYTNKQASRD